MVLVYSDIYHGSLHHHYSKSQFQCAVKHCVILTYFSRVLWSFLCLYFTFAPVKVGGSVFVLLFPVSANTAITVVTWGMKKRACCLWPFRIELRYAVSVKHSRLYYCIRVFWATSFNSYRVIFRPFKN